MQPETPPENNRKIRDIPYAVLSVIGKEFDKTLLFVVLAISVWLTVWSLSNNHKEAATAIQRLTDATAGALFALLAGNRKRE